MNSDVLIFLIKGVFAVLALAALWVYALTPIWRMLRTKPDLDLLLPQGGDLFSEEEELEIPTDATPVKPPREDMIRPAQERPGDAAQIIRRWLKEKK